MDGSGSPQDGRSGRQDPVSLRRTDLCSDCIERDDVTLDGRARPGRYGRIRDCLGCGGTTRQPSQKVDIVAWYVSTQERES
jgi:hypothetical protein